MEGRNHLKGIKKLRRMIIYDNNFDNKARQPGASLLSTIHRFVNQEKKISCQLSTRKKKSVDRFG